MDVYDFDLVSFAALARHIGTDTERVEVKAAADGVPRGIAETLSAFSNGSGGVIVLGLAEADGFRPVEGFSAKAVADGLGQCCNEKMEPPVRASIDIVEFEGAPVVVAVVPELPPHLKPCYVKARSRYEGSYLRMGDGDRRLSPYEVDRILGGRHEPRYDRQVVPEATMDELDGELVEGFVRKQRAESPRAFNGMGDEELLEALCVAAKDGDGVLRPTLAGLMALGRFPQRHFPRACVSFSVIPGCSKADVTADNVRFLDSRDIVGSIPVMISETMASVRRNMRVVSRMQGAFRTDVAEYPEVAVREAVANALLHRDYSPEGCASQVQVNMYDNRIEIMSPGGLFKAMTVERLGELGVSFPRNQALANILKTTPYAEGCAETGSVVENKGTGYFQICGSMRKAGLPDPDPRDYITAFVLNLYKAGANPQASRARQRYSEGEGRIQAGRKEGSDRIVRSVTEWVPGASGPTTIHIVNPGTVDYDIVEFLAESDRPVRSSALMAALGKSRATISRALGRLLDQALVERVGAGHGPGTAYRLAEGNRVAG